MRFCILDAVSPLRFIAGTRSKTIKTNAYCPNILGTSGTTLLHKRRRLSICVSGCFIKSILSSCKELLNRATFCSTSVLILLKSPLERANIKTR